MNKILKIGLAMGLALMILGGISLFVSSQPTLADTHQEFSALYGGNQVDDSLPLQQLPDIEIAIGEVVADGFNDSTYVTMAGDGSGRIFVTERNGLIWVIKNGQKSVFLDIRNRVHGDGEQGLMSMAFAPNYPSSGNFYVFYTSINPPPDPINKIFGDSIMSRFKITANPNVADPNSEQILLQIPQFREYHKAGQLLFGPNDGYLYVSVGDGAQSATAQNPSDRKGKIYRLEVEVGNPVTYTIPASNPFTNTTTYPNHLREIWDIGLRQAWRFSFDSANGDMYISDVGEASWEEISYEPAPSSGGFNYGWRCKEGFVVINTTNSFCDTQAELDVMTDPIAVFDHSQGSAAVTGGVVYRGTQHPDMVGRYFYADFSTGRIFSIYKTGPNSWSTPEVELTDINLRIVAFMEGEDGEVYLLNRGTNKVHRLIQVVNAPRFNTSTKKVSQPNADPGEVVAYTIHLNNTGLLVNDTFFLSDTLPTGISYVAASLGATQGTVDDSNPQQLKWQGQLTPTSVVTITYQATVTGQKGSLVNQAMLSGGGITPLTLSADIFVPKPKLMTTLHDFFLPGTQPNTISDTIPSPAVCGACHTEPIYNRWRGSMMGQAGRDPLMWSALSVANNDAPNVGDYCLRCHTPKGWLEGRSHPADGAALLPEDVQAGVACEICHRMVDPVPATSDEAVTIDAQVRASLTSTLPSNHVGSAMLILDPVDNRRGPFSLTPPHSAYRTDFLGQAQQTAAGNNYLTVSRMCGTCHNVDNPTLSWDQNRQQYWPNEINQPAPSVENGDLFPIERTFEEWKLSEYAAQGVQAPQFAGEKPDGMVGACQDCHMKRITGTAAAGGVQRDCQGTGCLPEHIFVGGNAWVPQILQDDRWRLQAGEAEIDDLNDTVIRAQQFLQLAATMTATLAQNGGQKVAMVRVVNETGHKLPTGYPEGRRMWLNLKAYDANDQLIYESGAYDQATAILNKDADIKIYEAKLGITPELAPIVDLPAGESFHFVLNNTYVKDNRIPPRGYTQTAFDKPGLRPVAASYTDGQYWDDTPYPIPNGTVRVEATLYYQTSSKEYIDFLRANGGVDGKSLGQLWDTSPSPPQVVATASANMETSSQFLVYLPQIYKN